MKIHYISGAAVPSQSAQSVHVMRMCAAFARAGHNVCLYAKGQKNNIFEFYGVKENFKIIRSSDCPLPFFSSLNRVLKILTSKTKPDILYGRDLLALFLLAGRGSKIFYESHQIHDSWFLKLALRCLIAHPDFGGMIAISKNLKSDLLAANPKLKPQLVLVAHDGADCHDIDKAATEILLQGRPNSLKIGYAGSLHPGKGGDFLVKLAALIPEADFHILGGDDAQIQNLKRDAGRNVFFYGHIPHSQVPHYLSCFDILAAPYAKQAFIASGSDIARWISPLKIFEYMAVKRPVVCSDLPVIREVLKSGCNAVLCESEDLDSWREGIVRLKDNKGLQESIAAQAYADLKDSYSWDARAQKILNFIKDYS